MDDLARLDELEDLFGQPWDALMLVCLLEDGDMRYRQLGDAMQRRATRRVPDPRINSSIHNLTNAGLIGTTIAEDGNKVHTLTDQGRRKAEKIQWTFAALDHYGR
jgi:DNA-binding PadR family transcriptional regulator